MILLGRNRSITVAQGLAGVTVAYAMATSTNLYSSLYLVTLVGAFIYGAYQRDLYLPCIVYLFLITINLAIGLSMSGTSPYGFFGNPNYFGCALTLGLAICIAYYIWLFIPFMLIGLLWCQSRGALIAAGALILCTLWRYSRLGAIALFIASLATCYFLGKGSFPFFSRLGIWQDTINHFTVWGTGWGSFFDAYYAFPIRTNVGFERAQHAYNDFFELIFELGIGVIPLWLAIILCLESSKREPKIIFLTYLALSLSFFPLYIPVVGHVAILALGMLSNIQTAFKRNPQWLAGS